MHNNLPTIYACFEQKGKEEPVFHEAFYNESEAKEFCKNRDQKPKSGWCFYRPYNPSEFR